VAGALLGAGCGGTSASASGGGSGGAAVTPASAPVFVTLDTDASSDQWKAADALLSKFPGRATFLTSIRTSLTKGGLSWETDIRPALGKEVDVAVLDLKRTYDVVALLQPADDAKFAALVKKGNANDPKNKAVYEKVGDWTVVADSQAKIDLYKKQASGAKLADDATFKNAMGKLSGSALVKAYANGQQVTAALQSAFPSSATTPVPAGKLVSGVAELVAAKDGVKLDGTVLTEGVKQQLKPYKAALLDQVPAGALLFLSFDGEQFASQANLSKSLQQGLSQSGTTVPGLQKLLPLLVQLGSTFAHENALYVRPGAILPEITLITQPDSPQQGMAAIDKLVAAIAPIKPKPITIGGVQAKEISLGQISIFYGVEGGKLIVTDQEQAFQDLKGSGAKLSSDANFKEAVAAASMPDQTSGFLYVNLKDSIALIEGIARLGGSTLSPTTVANLRPLRTFLAWGTLGQAESTFTAFLHLN
jgi:hypothetical protein